MPATELDRAFRVWGTDQAPVAWKAPQARRYDQEARLAEAVKAEVAPIRLTARAVVTPRARAEANLRDWHARYAASSAAVKRALGPVVQLYRHRVPTDVVAACGNLAASVRELRAESTALASPLPGVAADLDAAYDKMAQVAAACAKGDDPHRLERPVHARAEAGQRGPPAGAVRAAAVGRQPEAARLSPSRRVPPGHRPPGGRRPRHPIARGQPTPRPDPRSGRDW